MMKRIIYTLLFTLAGLAGMAQTNQPLPSGAVPFGSTTYLSPLDSTIWLYKERDGTAIKVANWVDVDSLFGLGYTKAQVDALLSGKQNTITGAASTAVNSDFTPNRVVITGSNGKLAATANLTTTELGYLYGVTSPLQAQLNGKSDTSKLASFTDISASLKGGNVIFFGDSYIAGSGASPSSNRWSTLFSKQFGATENNQGIAGATLMKRAPIDYMGAQNMIDRVASIPSKTDANKMLVFAFGLNDMGQTAAAYTTENFKTDYATVLNYAINTRGWKPSQILIVGAYYIGSAGYSRYATITGNAAPTQSRHLAFIQATKEVAEQFGTMYIDMYSLQSENNKTLLVSDGIHPNNAGYEYIFRAVTAQFENTDYLPMSGGILRGSLGFQNDFTNVPSISDASPSSSYMNLDIGPRVNSGNVAQSLSVFPRGSGIVSGGAAIRSQIVVWNQDWTTVAPIQEGIVLRATGDFYELATVGTGGGSHKPITISARGQIHNTVPSIYVSSAGTVAINKNTGINTAAALDINGGTVSNGNITTTGNISGSNLIAAGDLNVTGNATITGDIVAANHVNILSAQANLDFPSTPAGEGTTLTITVAGASTGDAVAIGVSATNETTAYIFTAWVSATNTVSVKFINMTTDAINPAPQLIKVRVIK